MTDPKDDLRHYLHEARDALLWKLEGLSEYDVRRPLTRTGTNLLGLVKHLSLVELVYFGYVFGRQFPDPPAWLVLDAPPGTDLWATEDESREHVVDVYRRACAHSDATIEALALDEIGVAPWWPEERRRISLHRAMVHMIAETQRHAGHADIVRELVDGAIGYGAEQDYLPPVDQSWWDNRYDTIEAVARSFA